MRPIHKCSRVSCTSLAGDIYEALLCDRKYERLTRAGSLGEKRLCAVLSQHPAQEGALGLETKASGPAHLSGSNEPF